MDQMLKTGCLDKPSGGRYVVVISRVTNDTSQYIDTDQLIKKIRVAMLNSGKAVITTAVGLTGPEDQMSGAVRELSADQNFNQATVAGQGEMIAPDLSVSGKIIERRPNAGTKYGLLFPAFADRCTYWSGHLGRRATNHQITIIASVQEFCSRRGNCIY